MIRHYKDRSEGYYALAEGVSPNAGWLEISESEADTIYTPTPEQLAAIAAAKAVHVQNTLDAQVARNDPQLSAIAAMTPSQAAQWIETNVTNLIEAKQALQIMAKAICILARRI